MKRVFIVLHLAASLLFTANGAFAGSSGGNFMRPNSDIRALEPPIDVTPEQLRAQQLPWENRSAYRPAYPYAPRSQRPQQ
jgi:hypothetical protein